jgi:hypothetical protein
VRATSRAFRSTGNSAESVRGQPPAFSAFFETRSDNERAPAACRRCLLAQEAQVSNTKSKNIHDPAIKSAKRRRERVYLGETSPQRRAHAETVLARYPELDGDELDELLYWYRREASSMDVALIASNEAIREPYRAFRRDHVDRFSLKEKLVGALLLAGGAGAIGALAGVEFAL